MVEHIERQSHRADHRFHQAFGLMQRHPECHAQHQTGTDAQVCVARAVRPASSGGAHSIVPASLADPRRQGASLLQCLFIFPPVDHPNDNTSECGVGARLCVGSALHLGTSWQARNLTRNPLYSYPCTNVRCCKSRLTLNRTSSVCTYAQSRVINVSGVTAVHIERGIARLHGASGATDAMKLCRRNVM